MKYRKKIHVLVIPSWYPEDSNDISGSFFREQAIALQKSGNKVGVIAPIIFSLRKWKYFFSRCYGLKKEIDENVITLRWNSINFTPRCKSLNQSRWKSIALRLFDLYVRENGVPDIIHVHSLVNAGVVARELKIKYGIPYVLTEHSSSFFRDKYTDKKYFILNSVVMNSSRNIAVSNSFKKLLENKFNTSAWQYLPNIVSEKFILSPLNEMKKKSPEFCFICVCFLNEIKKVDVLIEAFSIVYQKNKNVRLKIGGDGPLKDRLLHLSKALSVHNNIDFLGQLSRDEVLTNISNSDAFVLASEFETFGVVLIEALALGKPIIATKCGGPESIVAPSVGYLARKNSVGSLAETMERLMLERDKFSPKDIRKYSIDNFSETSVTNKLNEIYQSVLLETRDK